MTSVDTLPASELHAARQDHLGRQIDTQQGWRVIRDVRKAPETEAAVIIELVSDGPDHEVLAVWPDRLLALRDDGLERGNCFGVYTGSQVVETFRMREHAHLSLRDREPGFAFVEVVCPVHPHYLAEECPEDGPEDLAAVLAAEDRSNDDLLDSERRTCHYCQVWALDDEHLTTAGHQAAIERALAHSRTLRALPRAA